MESRHMDEILEIERSLGEIAGITSFQHSEETTIVPKEEIDWEEFPEPEEPAEVKNEGEGEGDDPVPEPDNDDDTPKEPVFDPT